MHNIVTGPLPGEVKQHNEMNQLTNDTGIAVVYDAAGNTTRRVGPGEDVHYVYDLRNQLVAVLDATSNVVARYAYAPDGRRLMKAVGGTTNYFGYIEEGLEAEFAADGTVVRSYGYIPNSTWGTWPLFMRSGVALHAFVCDHQGAPELLVSESGQIVWRLMSRLYGEGVVDPGSSVACPLRRSSQYFDAETGLHDNFRRTYDPVLGRYLQRDPIEEGGGVNLYAFASGDPISRSDPLGLAPAWDKVDCVEIAVEFSLDIKVGAGVSASAYGKVKVCDCCLRGTSRIQRDDYLYGGIGVKVGVGLGLKLEFMGLIDIGINGPSASVSRELGLEKECGKAWRDVEAKSASIVDVSASLGATLKVIYGPQIDGGWKAQLTTTDIVSRSGYSVEVKLQHGPFVDEKFSVGPVSAQRPKDLPYTLVNRRIRIASW